VRSVAPYVFASCLLACASSPPAPPPEPARAPAKGETPRAPSPFALRTDYVERLRARVASIGPSGRASRGAQVELADALVGVAGAALEEAMSRDRRVRDLPPPEDAAARTEADGEEGSDAPLPEGSAPLPPRPAAALAALSPAARAYVDAHDRALVEAASVYARAMVGERDPQSASVLAARQARVLTTLGQRHVARQAWVSVLRGKPSPEDAFDAWIAFADYFAERQDDASLTRFLDKARMAAAELPDRGASCARARAWVRHVSVAAICESAPLPAARD
jgi:hypothetical protein